MNWTKEAKKEFREYLYNEPIQPEYPEGIFTEDDEENKDAMLDWFNAFPFDWKKGVYEAWLRSKGYDYFTYGELTTGDFGSSMTAEKKVLIYEEAKTVEEAFYNMLEQVK